MNRETELRAEVARMEAAGRPFREVRDAVAALAAEVARRVREETAAEARRGAITSEALSVSAETLKTPQGPEIGHNGQTVKGTTMTHPNPHFAAHPPQPNDPPRPRPIGKPTPPTPAGMFGPLDPDDDDDGLTPEEETRRFLQLLPFCGIHGQPFRPRLSRAQLLEAENKIFYNV